MQAVRGEKRLDLVITFKRLEDVESQIDRIGQTRRVRSILGVEVPNIIIPVSEGRDLVNRCRIRRRPVNQVVPDLAPHARQVIRH